MFGNLDDKGIKRGENCSIQGNRNYSINAKLLYIYTYIQ